MNIDGTRMFRSVPNDFRGIHGMGMPTVQGQGHVHLEFLRKTPSANYVVTKNVPTLALVCTSAEQE